MLGLGLLGWNLPKNERYDGQDSRKGQTFVCGSWRVMASLVLGHHSNGFKTRISFISKKRQITSQWIYQNIYAIICPIDVRTHARYKKGCPLTGSMRTPQKKPSQRLNPLVMKWWNGKTEGLDRFGAHQPDTRPVFISGDVDNLASENKLKESNVQWSPIYIVSGNGVYRPCNRRNE